jgi:hypothetical protein
VSSFAAPLRRHVQPKKRRYRFSRRELEHVRATLPFRHETYGRATSARWNTCERTTTAGRAKQFPGMAVIRSFPEDGVGNVSKWVSRRLATLRRLMPSTSATSARAARSSLLRLLLGLGPNNVFWRRWPKCGFGQRDVAPAPSKNRASDLGAQDYVLAAGGLSAPASREGHR